MPIRKSENGWPIMHTNGAAAAYTVKKAAPGRDMSYYITGLTLMGGADGDSVRLLRQTCPELSAAVDTITMGDNAVLEPGDGDFSFELWLKIPSGVTNAPVLMDKYTAGNDGWKITVASSKLVCTIGDGVDTQTITSWQDINDDQWHHVVITCDRDDEAGFNLYIDGVLAATATDPTDVDTIAGGADDLVITGINSQLIRLSAFGIYKAGFLSATDVINRYLQGIGAKFDGTETYLSAAWNMDEGQGTTIHDVLGTVDATAAAGVAWKNDGAPFDEHDLPTTVPFLCGKLTGAAGMNSGLHVTFEPAMKIGRNCPIILDETDGAFHLILHGGVDSSND